jgi:DNA-binding GntR family transcriptional regulator
MAAMLPSVRRSQGSHHRHGSNHLATSSLVPIEYRTLNDLVTDRLRSAILSGHLPPGTALNQRDIADQLSVSRMPVREAFRTLELEGLIRGMPRRKAIVVALQPEDVADIFDILATLERRAAERAVPAIDASGLAELRALLDARREAGDDPVRLLDLDLELHMALYQKGGSRHSLLIQTHRNTVRPYMLSTGFVRQRRQTVDAEHEAIVRALAAGDTAGAVAAVAAHAQAEGRDLVEHLRALGQPRG